jgi:hypothetical protein
MIATRTENRYYAKAADIPPEMLAAPPTGSGELRRPLSIATDKRTMTAANAMTLPPGIAKFGQIRQTLNPLTKS